MQDKLKLDKALLKEARNAGIQEHGRAATYFLTDHADAYTQIGSMFNGKLEIMDTRAALKKYDWLKDYYWKAVSKDKDEFTKQVADDLGGGYFIRIFKGQKVNVPIQSCLMIKENKLVQRIHNIIIAEEGSEANIISGCVQSHGVSAAMHIGVSEFYIKKGAKLNFTMIHNWSSETKVRPRSASWIEDDATFVSNYICLTPVKDIQMYPVGLCNGNNSVGRFTSLLYAHQNSLLDVGGKVDLVGKGSKAEIISRVIALDTSTVYSRGMLIGTNPDSKGHLECSGLLLGKKAKIIAVPELAANAYGSELSHEAAVGKIADKELLYLMSRGLSQEEATSVIIRGFLDTKIFGLPEHLQKYIDSLMERLKGAGG
jgi:uncharacterized protein